MVKAAAEGPSPTQANPLNRDAKNKGPYAARKDCIKRKTRELSILCGIAACTVIVSPNGEVDTWPENPTDVKSIIDRYKEHIDDPRRVKKSPRPSGFPGEEISLSEFLSGWREDWLRGLSRGVLGSFLGDLESKLRAMESRIDGLNETNYEQRNPQRGKSMVPHNYGYVDRLPPFQEVHSADSVCCYHPVYVEPLNWYRPSDEDDETCEDCTQQLFPMAAIHSQPLLLLDEDPIGFEDVNPVQPVAPPVVEGSLNGYYGDLDEVDENSSNYCRQFFPLNG